MTKSSSLKQYEEIFGREKIKSLFADFQKKIDSDNEKIKTYVHENDLTNLRIIYHSISSAALIFDMEEFASICRNIEKKILENVKIEELQQYIEQANILYKQEIVKVKQYLETNDE